MIGMSVAGARRPQILNPSSRQGFPTGICLSSSSSSLSSPVSLSSSPLSLFSSSCSSPRECSEMGIRGWSIAGICNLNEAVPGSSRYCQTSVQTTLISCLKHVLTRCAIKPFKQKKKKDSDIQELLQSKSIVAEMGLLDDDENILGMGGDDYGWVSVVGWIVTGAKKRELATVMERTLIRKLSCFA